MGIEVLISLVAGALSALAGGIATTEFVERLLRRVLKRPARRTTEGYSERLEKLTAGLRQSSAEVDSLLRELSAVAEKRQSAVDQLESQLTELQTRERTLQQNIEHLQRIPLPVAEYLASLSADAEKRSAKRDYLLFGLGVLVTTLLSVLFFALQG